MAWVREQAPWLPEDWVGIYAGYAMRFQLRAGGKRPSIDEITEHLRTRTFFAKSLDGPVIGIKPTKGSAA